MAKAPAKKPPTKTEIMSAIADSTGLTKKEVASVFDALQAEVKTFKAKQVGAGGDASTDVPPG